MSQPSLSILLLGMSPYLVHTVTNRLRAQGIDVGSIVVTNSLSSDAEVARLVSSKNWNGFIIGKGVESYREWYQRLLQIIHNINPNIPMIHSRGPDDGENAIERQFNVRLPLIRPE